MTVVNVAKKSAFSGFSSFLEAKLLFDSVPLCP